MSDLELVQDARAEGPVWDERTSELLCLEVTAGVVHRVEPRLGA